MMSSIFTREDLRKRYEKAQETRHIYDLRFVENALRTIKNGVLKANDAGDKSYTFIFGRGEPNSPVLIEEIRKRVSTMFVDSNVTVQRDFLNYVKIIVVWDAYEDGNDNDTLTCVAT
jgi:hypothetical protein